MSDIPRWDAFPRFRKRWLESVAFFPVYNMPFLVVGRVYLAPFDVPWRVLIDAIAYYVMNVSAGNVRIGLYREGPTADDPDGGGLVVESGSVAQPGTTRLHIIPVADTLVEPGQYFVGLQGDDTTGTFSRGATEDTGVLSMYYDHAYGVFTDPCPATTITSYVLNAMLRVKRNLV